MQLSISLDFPEIVLQCRTAAVLDEQAPQHFSTMQHIFWRRVAGDRPSQIPQQDPQGEAFEGILVFAADDLKPNGVFEGRQVHGAFL
jgi:hypothetical protein